MKPIIYKNYYDVVILPSKKANDYAIGLSSQLAKYDSELILGRKKYLPHISLYHIPVKPDDFNEFIAELEKIAKGQKIKKLKLKELKPFWPHHSVMLMTDKPQWLSSLSFNIIKRTLKYFDRGYGVEKLWHIENLSLAMRVQIKKYGTPLAGRYFMPHITLGVFSDREKMIQGYKTVKPKHMSFEVSRIFVCQLGEHHTCQKIIKEIAF